MKVRKVIAVVALSVVTVTGCAVGQQSARPGAMMGGQRDHQVSMMQGFGDWDLARSGQRHDRDRCWMPMGRLMHRWVKCEQRPSSQLRSCRMFQR
jgi:hypothetical protein